MLSNKTTELSVIRERPNRFTWGRVAKFHDVGPYTLVEFIPDRLAGAPGQAPEFHVYVDGHDTCRSTATLDGALVLAVGHRNLEANRARYMAMAAVKLLGVAGEPE